MQHWRQEAAAPFADGLIHAAATSTTRKSWLERNWKWFIPACFLIPVFLCSGGVVLLFGAIKSSGAYQQSLAWVTAHPDVEAALGTPIEAGFLVTGNIQVSESSGNAELAYTVSGPDDSGSVYVVATKYRGSWAFETLRVVTETGGEEIDLLAGAQPDY